VVLNAIAWLILLLFKNGIPKNTVYQLGGCCHTIGIYYERCIHITCKGVHVLLSKTQRANLMDLANSCINRQILQLFKVHQDLTDWCTF
jgi:hypothetical protein